MKHLKYTEHQLQKAILQRLSYKQDIYYLRNNSIAGKFIRPDGSTGWLRNAKKGSPDIILCKNGIFLGLEVKNATGAQSDDQARAEKDIRKAGGQYFIVRSLDELEYILDNF